MSKEVLSIFVKNLIPGTVKTRLAEDLGMDLAMEIYKELVGITAEVTDVLKIDKCVYYSEYIESHDQFDDAKYIDVLRLVCLVGGHLGPLLNDGCSHLVELAITDGCHFHDTRIDVGFEPCKELLGGCVGLSEPLVLDVHEAVETLLLCGEARRRVLEPPLNSH